MKTNNVYLILLLGLLMSCYSQFKNKRYAVIEGSRGAIEIYHRDESGKKHGKYRAIDSCGNIIIKGKMNHGLRVGEWKFYNSKHQVNQIIKYDESGQVIHSKRINEFGN